MLHNTRLSEVWVIAVEVNAVGLECVTLLACGLDLRMATMKNENKSERSLLAGDHWCQYAGTRMGVLVGMGMGMGRLVVVALGELVIMAVGYHSARGTGHRGTGGWLSRWWRIW